MSDDYKFNIAARLVHLDFKGAPLCISYIEKVLPFLKAWGVTGLLIEYEDTFPYDGELKALPSPHAYSKEDIKQILKLASDNELDVIPLVQTFGHLEFVLKHEKFAYLREVKKYPMALCPSNPDSAPLVCKMVDQVMQLHPNIQYFHIGCDEVYHLGVCDTCKERMGQESLGKDQLFFSHVREVASHVRKNYPSVTCIVWDDMFRFCELPVVLNCGLENLVEPMVWHYLNKFMLPPDLWDNLSAVFPNIWVASAFKGATGPRAILTNIRYHLDNHSAWLDTLRLIRNKFKNIQGIALTGWQRYDHYAVLCELFPHGLPSLGLCLRFIQQGVLSPADVEALAKDMKFTTPVPINSFVCNEIPECEFPGSSIYQLMIEFVHTENAVNEFFALEGMAAWMNEYNIERKFINPIHVEPMLSRALSLLLSVNIIKGKVNGQFSTVFVEGVQKEWQGIFLLPLIKRLEIFVHKSRAFVADEVRISEVNDM